MVNARPAGMRGCSSSAEPTLATHELVGTHSANGRVSDDLVVNLDFESNFRAAGGAALARKTGERLTGGDLVGLFVHGSRERGLIVLKQTRVRFGVDERIVFS